MDAQQFLAEFRYVAQAPNGIAKLRELVLTMAFQGLFTKREPEDSNVEESLEKINSIKKELVSKGEIPRQKFVPDIVDNSIPYTIPNHWKLVRFGNISQHNTGKTLDKRRNTGKRRDYITTSNLYWGRFELEQVKQVPIEEKEIKKCIVTKGDLLICEGGEAGRAAVWEYDYDICFQNHVHRARFYCGINPYYAFRFFEKLAATGEINEYRKGIGISSMSGKSLAMIPFPLPPVEEQSRIVAKVDELMALCDKLEAQQQVRRKLQNALRQATLEALAAVTCPQELKTTWEQLEANFGRLFGAPEDVDDLRKSILDLAVSGYFSDFDASDQPASVLKERIHKSKQAGIADGSVARKKHVKPEELQKTALPAHWETITLDDAISMIDAGWSPACLPSARDDESKWGVLKTTSVQVLRFLPHEHKELPASLDPRPQYQIEVGDILITRAGPKNRVGICCVVDIAPRRLIISDKLIRFHIVDDLIDPHFVSLCLSAGEPGRILEKLKSGMAESQMNISQNKLRSITIPLPPMEEQQRILAKINAVMGVIDTFEGQLRKAVELSGSVAATVISSLTGIAIEQKREVQVKAPQTELIAPLRLGQTPDVGSQAPLATILSRHNGELEARDLWQRFGGEIDAFYAQLKTEVANGWIDDPSYVLDPDAPKSPKKYPNGSQVAKMKDKEA